jgi:pimeloyl-ACP methyl ester carboxylesterase
MSLTALLLAIAASPLPAAMPPAGAIEAPGPIGPLKGTITGPSGAPVVLILPGSGPTDRDGNNSLGVTAAPYRLLAEGLAAQGIASVRIDKRGMFGSAGATANPDAVTIDDYVDDTEAWITAIRARTGASCIWLLGHSEGGLIALATAARMHDMLCGVVLVSTAGRPLGEVLKTQLRANAANAPLLDAAERAIDTLAKGGRVDVQTLPPPLASLFRPSVQGFEASIFGLDPAALIHGITVPILILQGERDVQVDSSEADHLKAARPTARLVRLPDTNHVLKTVKSNDRGANLATYVDATLPLAPGVVDAIVRFVRGGGR